MLEDVWHQRSTPTEHRGTGIRAMTEAQQRRANKNVEHLPYYHYRLHRTDVEALIREDGDFIVRRGTRNDPDGFTVSVRWGGRMLHFPVHWVKGQCCFEDDAFSLVQNLIHHHVSSGEPVTKKSKALLLRARTRHSWELLESDIIAGKKLGNGAFGTVYEAKWSRPDGISVTVAMKTLDTVPVEAEGGKILENARNEMLCEARIMRELSGHPNLVRAFGVTIDRELPYAVMELMTGGSLDKRLRAAKPLSIKTKLKVALEVSRGLSYMNRSGFIHRDVSARNILYVAEGDDVGEVKITDFGMTRKLDGNMRYKAPLEEQFPVVWTAIEGLSDRVWYEASDVWGMGILIWEIFADGAKPYCELEDHSQEAMIQYLQAGKRMGPSEAIDIPANVDKLLQECWESQPELRPPMFYVCWKLQDEWVAAK